MSQTKHCHPLKYTGSSQVGRLMAALQPGYFRLDERSLQDLIVGAHHYAQALRFFDHNDQHPEGAYWDRFWEVEMLTYLAVVAAKDTDELRRKYEEADRAFFKKINEKTGGKKGKNTGESPLAGYLPLIELLHQLAWSLENTYQKLARIGHPLQIRLLNSIRRDNCCDTDELESALRKLIKFHKAATPSKTPLSYTRYEGFFSDDKRWGLRNRTDFEAIVPDTQITQEALREIFITYYDAWLLLKRDAQEAFDTELARAELPEDVEERAMEPHVALFIAFLRLFRHAQDSLNDLSEKHLDYYYDQILGLCRRPETPDEVWLIFELAKDVDQFLLQKGEAFLAGNDKNGAPLLFENLEEWVLRQATVADIRNTYIDRDCGKINANPDVSKAYENGVEKPNESAPHWRSMGDDNHLPDGHLGWAFASPQLILREGKRTIDLKMKVTAPDNPDLSWIAQKDLFGVWLSTEEDWVRLEHNAISISSPDATPELPRGAFNVFFTDKTLHFRIVLERDDPAIEAFGEEAAAKAGFDTQWPMLKVVINPTRIADCPPNSPSPTTAEVYETLRNLCIGEIRIGVKAAGIRENLIFQNDQGLYDGTQKVFPFGPVPEVGNKFYLGSTEVFQKALTCLKVCFDWIAPPDDFNAHYAAYQHNNNNSNLQSPKINFPLPNPFLKIDFIDRADVPVPKQLVKLGKRSGQDNLSGVLTDLNGIPLQGIRIVLLDANNVIQNEVFTDANGSYSIAGPIDATQTIQFLPPKQDDSNPDQSVLYEALSVAVEEFSVINAILFPKSVVFGKFGQIKGRLEDIYGNPISSGVSVSLDGTFLAIDSNGEFTAAAKGLQNLVITAQAMRFKAPSSNAIQLDDFTRIRIILEPAENVQPSGSAISATDPRISGAIQNNRPAPSPKHNAYVEVSDNNQTIKVFSDQNGAYELPLFAPGNTVRFYPDAYASSIMSLSPIEHNATKQTVNARLIAEKQVQKKFRENKIRVRVKNYENTPIISGVAFATTPGATIPTELIGQTFELTLPSTIADNATTLLAISGSGYETVSFRIEHYAEFEVMVFPTDFVLRGGNFSGTITGTVRDRNGTPLEGYQVEDDDGATGTVTGASYEITPGNNATTLTFSKLGFANFSLPINNSAEISVFMKPDTAAPAIGATIAGTLKQADNKPAAGVHVTVEGFIGGKYAKYETQTDSSGAYNLLRADGLSNSRFTFSRDGFVAEAQSAGLGLGALFLSEQVKKIHPVQPTLRGTVYSMNGPVENALVSLPNGAIAKTNKDGLYAFALSSDDRLSGPTNAIEINHPGYQILKVNAEQGCLQLDLRLIPLPAHFVVSGKITDVLGAPVPQVQVGLADFAITTMADNLGHYEIAIPVESASDLKFKAPTGFEEKNLIFGTEYPNPGLKFDKSNADIILYYENINYVGLLDASSAIKPCFNVNINALNLVRDIRTQHFEKHSPTLRRGFLVFTLEETDFLHKAYPQALSYYALSAPTLAHTLNPPYTPAVNGISLEYCSEQVITGAENAGIDRFYHLLPFNGHKEVSLLTPDRLPVYPYNPHDLQETPKALDPYATGNLYIGIEKLQPGSAISLLFRVAAGTERNPELLPPQLVWSWLGPDNRWYPFGPGQVLRDETRGLTRSGMVQLAVPNAAVNRTTMLPGDLYWLRVAAIEDPLKDRAAHALPALGGIDAQVVRARFANKDNELSHLAAPLPAETISGLLESRAEVRGVTQPLPSVGGRLPESTGFAFRTRVSERLRHKDRAVTLWDFERLLLEQYPDVAVARCIPHTRYKTAAKASELAPGYVSVAVAPNPALHDGPWLMPRFPKGDLDEMRDFLAARANLFAAYGEDEEAYLQVLNPHYETLDIQVKVYFLPEYSDVAFYEKKLAEELRDYISPWLANPQAPPVFGRSIARSKILQFIEERYYVDYVDLSRDDWGNYTEFRIRRLCVNTAGQILDRHGNPLTEKCLLTQPPAVEWVAAKACPATARSIFVAGHIAVNAPLPDLIKCPVISDDPTGGDEQDGEIDVGEERPTSVAGLAQGPQQRAAAPADAAPKEKKSRKPRQKKASKP